MGALATRRRSRGLAAVVPMAVAAVLLLGACGTAGDRTPAEPAASASTEAPVTPTPEPTVTVADIAAAVADAEWSFAADGLGEPFTIALADGVATDEYGRTFSLGEAVAGDADGDGVVDAVIPIMMIDGNAPHQLWYIWLGRAAGADPVQVIYPIARATRCGDLVQSVTAVDGGFEVAVLLRMPYTDDARSCADGGTGALTRTVSVTPIDGDFYPVQSAPVVAWGGVCPPTMWLDGSEEVGLVGRVAPPASAALAFDGSRPVGVFALGEAPLVTVGGVSFFGFIQDDADVPVKMHCAFAGWRRAARGGVALGRARGEGGARQSLSQGFSRLAPCPSRPDDPPALPPRHLRAPPRRRASLDGRF